MYQKNLGTLPDNRMVPDRPCIRNLLDHDNPLYYQVIPSPTASNHSRKIEIESEMVNLFFPARRAYSPRPTRCPTPPPPAPKSGVISIPVHFANDRPGSPEPDRSSAAVKIQKFLRGFLVRKNMQTVKKIAAEAVEIGHQISAVKFRADALERQRIGEMLMALLLRLDAVRGIREYRKKVIRQVIQLQEAVDSIAGKTPDSNESKPMDDMVIPAGDGDNDDLVMDDCPAAEEIEEAEPLREVLTVEETSKDSDEEIEGECWGIGESFENAMEEAPVMAELTPAGGSPAEVVAGMKEAMERASAETEALRRMVGELCERSAQQCELMSGLVQRVEQMERRMHRLERRRKKQAGASPLAKNKQ